jgi:hypothetical protein
MSVKRPFRCNVPAAGFTMAVMVETVPGKKNMAEDDPAELILTIARDEAAEALRVSELLDGKARSLPQVATVFFAASQAAVAVILGNASDVSLWIALAAAILGLAGLLAVSACLVLAVRVQTVEEQSTLNVRDVREYVEAESEKGHKPPMWLLVGTFTQIVEDRREKNDEKADAVEKAQRVSYLAIGLTSSQLLLGLIATVVGVA